MNTCRANRNVGNKVGIYSQLLCARHIQRRDAFGSKGGEEAEAKWNAWHGAKKKNLRYVFTPGEIPGIANQK
jgi:hypothetical protein